MLFRRFIALTLLTLFLVNVVDAQSDFLIRPAVGAVVTDTQPIFEWQTVSGAISYKLVVRTPDRSYIYKVNVPLPSCTTTCLYTPTDAAWSLRNNTGYEWFVTAKFVDAKIKAPKRSFTTSFPVMTAPTLIAPVDKSRVTDAQVVFSWTNTNANEYVVRIADATVGQYLTLKKVVPSSVCDGATCSVTAGELGLTLPLETGYEWKVTARTTGQKAGSPKALFIYNPTEDSYSEQLLDLVNAERCALDLVPLVFNDQLNTAATVHSLDMIVNAFFSHMSSDGSSPMDRALAAGYPGTYVGENIAMGYSSPQDVFNGWMNSDGHRTNILRPEYREMGLSYSMTHSTQYNMSWALWTQVFGKTSDTALATCP
jgi:uncharacterized protein YkwD